MICKKSDFLWKSALLRLVKNEPYLWEEGLQRLIAKLSDDEHQGDKGEGDEKKRNRPISLEDEPDSYESYLVETAREALQRSLSSSSKKPQVEYNSESDGSRFDLYKQIYQLILSKYLRYTSPVFHMSGLACLGQEFGLHFFEPRYRLLISEVMAPYPDSARSGEVISTDKNNSFPTFIYANNTPLALGTPACIVQVRQCRIHANATADVFLVPIAHVRIERFWERPYSGGLIEARVMRMKKDETTAINDQNLHLSRCQQAHITDLGSLNERNAIQAILQYLAGRNSSAESDNEDE